MLEEGIDHLEHRALLGGGELLDLLEALHEARRAGSHGLRERREPEQLIGGDLEGARERGEHWPGWLKRPRKATSSFGRRPASA